MHPWNEHQEDWEKRRRCGFRVELAGAEITKCETGLQGRDISLVRNADTTYI